MCGLVGMAGTMTWKMRDTMKDLLFLNSLRGKDSTGLSCVRRNRAVVTQKRCVPGYEFIDIPACERIMETGDQIWMAHGRFKTMGAVTKANAHPFEVENGDGEIVLVGAHNGTLDNKYAVENELKEKFDTDSEGLMNLLAYCNENYKEAIKKIRGAWALVWWDAPNNRLHFLRNQERPFTYAFSKDRTVILWASESWMIYNAAKRNGLELATNERGISCFCTTPDRLYSLDIPQEKDKRLPELKSEGGYEGAEPFFQLPLQGRWFGHPQNDAWHKHDPLDDDFDRDIAGTAPDKPKVPEAVKKEVEVARAENVVDLFKRRMSTQAFLELTKAGCSWCKGTLTDHNALFMSDEELVCRNCVYDKHPKQEGKNVISN